MLTAETLLALAVFATVATVTPGPNNALLLASGINHGFRRTLPLMAGIAFGFPVMVLAVGLGLGEVFRRLPWLHGAVKVAGGLYLLWLAWRIATAGEPPPGEAPRPLTFLQGAGFQWVNPKAWAMAVSAIAAYTVPAAYAPTTLMVALVFLAVALPSVALWAASGAGLGRLVAGPRERRLVNITLALLLVASLWPLVG